MATGGPVTRAIRSKLSQLNPAHLEIINESYLHNVPKENESHFKVVVVCDQFINKPLLQRHRMVNTLLKEELDAGLHALSIVAKTPEQWDQAAKIDSSPKCMGGFGK